MEQTSAKSRRSSEALIQRRKSKVAPTSHRRNGLGLGGYWKDVGTWKPSDECPDVVKSALSKESAHF